MTITQQGLDLTEVTTTYQYDAFGRRISKQTETKEKTRQVNRQSAKIIQFPVQQQKTQYSQVNYLWDGNRQLQEQTDTQIFTTIYEQDSFEPVARLVWFQDGIEIAANEPVYDDNPHINPDTNKPPKIQVYHCHNDHLGTPNELTNQDGEVVWLADYEAYGNTAKVVWREEKLESVQVTAEELQPIRFQGQSFDVETGLHYNRFRYFDPDLGMFTTRDPIGLMGGLNVFQYAPNPTGWVDPFGLVKSVNPKDINFSQRTISHNNYADLMKEGKWDWDRSPLNVMDVEGQLVSYDNRRLDAAIEAGVDEVKVNVVDPEAVHPDSTTGKTWKEKFQERFNDQRNKKAGGVVPPKGLGTRPKKPPKKSC